MAQVVILYPVGHDFDHEYYLNTHMPLVNSIWGSIGLEGWSILKFPEGNPYQVSAILRWESLDAFNKAAAAEGTKKVFGDIENFTTAKPVVLPGEVVQKN